MLIGCFGRKLPLVDSRGRLVDGSDLMLIEDVDRLWSSL